MRLGALCQLARAVGRQEGPHLVLQLRICQLVPQRVPGRTSQAGRTS